MDSKVAGIQVEDKADGDPVAWSGNAWRELGLPNSEGLELMTSVSRARELIVARIETILSPFDLGFSRYLLLTTLLLSKGLARRMSSLSHHIVVHPTTVTVVVDQLEKQGLVERMPHPTDRRVTLVHLTERGQAICHEASVALAEADFGLEHLSSSKKRELIRLLTDLRVGEG